MNASVQAELVDRLYALVQGLPRCDSTTDLHKLPADGIYLFFEMGELAPWRGGTTDRIVRIGINEKDGGFRRRIRKHYGRVKSLGGNRGQSAFRRHIGGDWLRRQDAQCQRVDPWLRDKVGEFDDVEKAVSQLLRDRFTFVWLEVQDTLLRARLEKGLIGLLAQWPLGKPSQSWLGHHAKNDKIRRAGLWNSDDIDALPLTSQELIQIESLAYRVTG